MDRIDCKTVVDRLPAWLDGELAAAERQWLEQHLERCPACADRAGAYAAQQEDLAALAPSPAQLSHPEAFWAPMDQRLAAALDAVELHAKLPAPTPIWRRAQTIGWPALGAYAAALLLLLVFGARQTAALSAAQARVQRLEADLERIERLNADAAPGGGGPLSAEPALYKTVVYTPERGHF